MGIAGLVATFASATVLSTPSRADAIVTDMVSLGAASTYAALTPVTVSNTVSAPSTPFTTLRGDVGAASLAGFPPGIVTGTIRIGAAAAGAQTDLATAYADAAGRTPADEFAGDVAGTTFTPGVHHATGAITNTGTITLDAQNDPNAVFIFQAGAALRMAANTHVVMVNGAQSSHVFWQVVGAVALGAGVTFVGTVMGLGAISLGAGAILNGRALSKTGPIAVDSDDFYSLPPAVTIAGGATAVTNSATPTLSGTSNLAAGTHVTVTIAGQTIDAVVQAAKTWSATPTLLANGTYAVSATTVDGAGNTGTATQSLTVDTVLPLIAIVGGATRLTNDSTPTISGTTDVATGSTVTVTGTGSPLTALVQAGGSWNVTPSALADNTYSVVASVSDAAGNLNTATQALTVDTTPPTVTITGGATRLTNSATPAVAGTTTASVGTAVSVTIAGQTTPTTVIAGGAWTVTSQALTNGTHPISVSIADAAGNIGTATQSLTVDTTLPLLTINGGATRTTNDTTPTLFGTTDLAPGSIVTVSLTGQTLTTLVQSDGSWNATPTALVAGAYTFIASVTDPAGNTATATQVVTIDTTPPVIAITGGLSATTSDLTPTIAGTTDATAGSTVTVAVGGQTLAAAVQADGSWAATAATLTTGAHPVLASVSDAAGNLASATQALTIDAVAPVISFTTGATGLTNDDTPTITGSTNVAAGAIVTVTIAGQVLTTPVQAGGIWSVTVTAATIVNGPHAVTASVSDTSGNPASAAQTLTVDLVAPMLVITGGSSRSTTDTTPTVTGTTDLATNSVITVTIAGQTMTTLVQPGGTWNATPTVLVNGVYLVIAAAVDPAGNAASASQSLTIATSSPVTVIGGATGATNDPTPTIAGSNALPGSTVTLTIGGQTYTATVGADGTWTITTTNLPDGTYPVVVTATDTAGNSGTTTHALTVDTVPPPVVIGGGGTGGTSDPTPAIGGSNAPPGSTVTVTVDGHTYTTTVGPDGTWTITTGTLPDGTYPVVVSVTDPAGNVATGTQVLSVVTVVPPTPTWRLCSTSPCTGFVTAGLHVQVQGTPVCRANSTSNAWSTAPPSGGLIDAYQVGDAKNQETFVVGADGIVYHNYLASPGVWVGWSGLSAPAAGIAGTVRAGNNYLGNQELYVLAKDGQVYHLFATPGVGSGWHGWDPLGAPSVGIHGDIFEGTNFQHNQELYVLGNDGNVYHKFSTPGVGSGWSTWDSLGHPTGITAVGDVQLGINYLCNQEVYVTGTDGNTYHSYSTPGQGSGWSAWSTLGAPAGGATGFASTGENQDNNQELFIVGADNNVYHDYSTPGKGTGWSGYSSLGAPPAKIISPSVWVDTYPVEQLTVWTTNGEYRDTATPGTGSGWSGWIKV